MVHYEERWYTVFTYVELKGGEFVMETVGAERECIDPILRKMVKGLPEMRGDKGFEIVMYYGEEFSDCCFIDSSASYEEVVQRINSILNEEADRNLIILVDDAEILGGVVNHTNRDKLQYQA